VSVTDPDVIDIVGVDRETGIVFSSAGFTLIWRVSAKPGDSR
jgi:hypothetical protein